MPYISIFVFAVLLVAGTIVLVYAEKERKRKENLEHFVKTTGAARFRLLDKVKINHTFFARPDCYGVVTEENAVTNGNIQRYTYCVDVFVKLKDSDKPSGRYVFPSDCLELIEEMV